MNYLHYYWMQAGLAVWSAGTSAEWLVRTERGLVISRSGAGETELWDRSTNRQCPQGLAHPGITK